MARHIVLLRGINIGSRNRIAMPELRQTLEKAGFAGVHTYLQSGNVVLSSNASTNAVARECERQIARRFKLDIDVVARSRADLTKVVQRNPLGDVADNPKLYQVTFLAGKLGREIERKLASVAGPHEQFVVIGSEVYAWHPSGVARSKLWALLASKQLGVTATSRNWTTVTKLLELAGA